MIVYNVVNGFVCFQYSYFINGILKDEFGFQGFVMFDWLFYIFGVDFVLVGFDMNMLGDINIFLFGFSNWYYEFSRLVFNGFVFFDRLNDMVIRIVVIWYKFGQDRDYLRFNFLLNICDCDGLFYFVVFFFFKGQVNWFVNVQVDYYLIVREVVQDVIIFFKNNGSFFFLMILQFFYVFGIVVQVNFDGFNVCMNCVCNKGIFGMGWGFGVVDYFYLDDLILVIRKWVFDVKFFNIDGFFWFYFILLFDDVVIVFIIFDVGENLFIVEGNNGDCNSVKLVVWYNGDELVRKIVEKYNNVIVVV